MFYDESFKPLHITAKHCDLDGNDGRGRYLFLPGSDARAQQIAKHFDSISIVRRSTRGHNLYLGNVTRDNNVIDVGVISTGMGVPSVEIILNELLSLGGKKFLRIGTCGLLQSHLMNSGDIAIATGAIKDEHASSCYVPKEYPAISSYEMLNAILSSCNKINFSGKYHTGIFHSKDSLYAREFKQGCKFQENVRYMDIIKQAGAIVSEMEASMIFTLCNIADANRKNHDIFSKNRVLAGAVCCILGEGNDFGNTITMNNTIQSIIDLGIASYVELNNKGY